MLTTRFGWNATIPEKLFCMVDGKMFELLHGFPLLPWDKIAYSIAQNQKKTVAAATVFFLTFKPHPFPHSVCVT